MTGFSASIEDAALVRADGHCEICGGLLKPDKVNFDHVKARVHGGGNTLENCQVLCVRCHLEKTLEDMSGVKRKAKKKPLELVRGEPSLARRGFVPAQNEEKSND